MKKMMIKTFSIFVIIALIIQTLEPITVIAENYCDGNKVSMGGTPTIANEQYIYPNGKVEVTVTNSDGTSSKMSSLEFSLANITSVNIKLIPNEGFTAILTGVDNDDNSYPVTLTGNEYQFYVGNLDNKTLSYTPSFVDSNYVNPGNGDNEPPVSAISFDFKINGVSFTNAHIGDTITVPDNFNFDSLDEFNITKIVIDRDPDADTVYEYDDDEFTLALKDIQNRSIFEAKLTKLSDKSALFINQVHSEDMLEADVKEGKTLQDYFGIYITSLYFVKDGFKGVEVSTGAMPDSYDFTKWNGADLSGTTKANPGVVTAYYGDDTIHFNSAVDSGVSEITLADNSIPSAAISIDNEEGTVTINSNYYNKIPLKIKLADGTVGYITVNRIGIFVDRVNTNNNTLFHGAANDMVTDNLNKKYFDENKIAAVFYHENGKTYRDYDLIANLTFADGTTKTVIAEGVSDDVNYDESMIGSNYIIWHGDKEKEPVSVSVTAVEKGTYSNDAKTFNGASFGSGSGVNWINDQGAVE